jgi:hypothetical protein
MFIVQATEAAPALNYKSLLEIIIWPFTGQTESDCTVLLSGKNLQLLLIFKTFKSVSNLKKT